ncbi:coiled-coil domain-containing protein 77-like isoform X2 [Penaeus japonicus]|uniref:coiled-coil domain-containing protein 77-like isoform X2 n=1 Tax=Penaeus japonicus TaxID=27405 RepID=UPI001C70C173|nr:coiled-coil domain-containing protein 77-like isoform X2 [Penaeus japonicus]
MAAAERLGDSILRMKNGKDRGIGGSRENPKYTCHGNHDMNVEEELAKLQPSQRLLDYYREKVATFEQETQKQENFLRKYEQVAKPTFLEKEREQMTRELIELRSALSDVNVFIHAERQQVVRLHAENERLKLDTLEAEKKVALMLSLTGLTEGELMVFLRDPRRLNIINQKLPPNLKKIQQKLKKDIKEPDVPESEIALRGRILSLEQQLEEAEKTWLVERNALLQDRTLTASETKAQFAKDQAHHKLLAAKIEEAQRHFKEAVAETMNKAAYLQAQEKIWLAERDHLLSVLSTVQENVPLVSHMQSVEKSGSYSDLAKPNSTCELKDLRRENETLKVELHEAEEMRYMYESQCMQLEQTMCKLREEKEALEKLYKERSQKLSRQIEMLKQDNLRMDERRKTDIKGFQSDIRLIKNDVKTIVHQIYKITMTLSGTDCVPLDLSALNDMQAVSALVRAVQKMITDTKRNILKLEADISNPNG